MFERVVLVVFDGFGIGSYMKNESYNSLAHAIKHYKGVERPCFTTLNRLGLKALNNNKDDAQSVASSCYGRTRQQSFFCDSFAAHWEMAGQIINQGVAFKNGIPDKYLNKIKEKTGLLFVGNEICHENVSLISPKLIKQHEKVKRPIMLTIPKCEPISTIGIVAFEDVIHFEDLKEVGKRIAETLRGEKDIGRVVVKTLERKNGKIVEGKKRADYCIFSPPEENLLYALQEVGVKTYATGKINGLFNGQGIDEYSSCWDDEVIFEDTIRFFNIMDKGFLWVNFNGLDRPYGHACDVNMWIKTLEKYDVFLAKIMEKITEKDILIFTGDHGCDPTGQVGHTKEWNPLFVYNPKIVSKKLGDHFHCDIGKTVAENFGIDLRCGAKSFLSQIELVN